MRYIDADYIRERIQDYFNGLKGAAPMEPSTKEAVEIINKAMLDIIDTTPSTYSFKGGY